MDSVSPTTTTQKEQNTTLFVHIIILKSNPVCKVCYPGPPRLKAYFSVTYASCNHTRLTEEAKTKVSQYVLQLP
jgi:hypothetical protein